MTRLIQSLDLKLFLALHRSALSPLLFRPARAISRTGDGWLYLLIMPGSILLLQAARSRELILLALLGFALERLFYLLLKKTLRRPRPPEAIKHYRAHILPADRFSLPSGHSSAAFYVATFLSIGVSPLFLPLYAWAGCVALSRLALGVHFPSDLVAGAALGSTMALLVL